MSAPEDDPYDDYGEGYGELIPRGMVWCDRCQGMGIANCHCGGDQCYCLYNGEMECPRCDGEGYHREPTPAEIEQAQKLRAVLRDMLAAQPKGAPDGRAS